MAEHISDFGTNEWRIGAIDKNGDVVVPFRAYDFNLENWQWEREVRSVYLGEGIFRLETSSPIALLDAENQSIVLSEQDLRDLNFITYFEDGYAIVQRGFAYIPEGDDAFGMYDPMYNGTFRLGANGNRTRIGNRLTSRYTSFEPMIEFSEGLTFLDGAFYNVYGEVVLEFPQYEGREIFATLFNHERAFISVRGADNLWYSTIIDKNGNGLFASRTDFSPESVTILDENHFVRWTANGNLIVYDMDVNEIMTIEGGGGSSARFNLSYGIIRIFNFPSESLVGYINLHNGSIIGRSVDARNLAVTMH